MAGPALARSDDAGDRFYPWKGDLFWSVTTLIGGGIPKYAIAPWSAKVVAELVASDILAHGSHARAHAAIRRWSRLGRGDVIRRQADGELKSIKLSKLTELELATRWLKGEPVRVRDAAAAIGSDVHAEAEAQVLRLVRDASGALALGDVDAVADAKWPDHLAGYAQSFGDFLEDWRPLYLATEATVFNRPQAYAGTLDAILALDADVIRTAYFAADMSIPAWLVGRTGFVTSIVDYKAGNDVHPEVGLQLSAYARAEFVGLPDRVTEAPLPGPIEFGAVLHITPKGYHLKPVRIDDEVFDAFKYVREVYRFQKMIAATVLGKDLAPARAKVAA